MNRKERRLALRTAFNAQAENLVVVESFADQLSQPKTKELAAALTRWGATADKRVLLILTDIPENIFLSARNIPYLKVLRADSLNIYDILVAETIVATPDALAQLQEVYSD
jgi:large subunit ribosomal protein L4